MTPEQRGAQKERRAILRKIDRLWSEQSGVSPDAQDVLDALQEWIRARAAKRQGGGK